MTIRQDPRSPYWSYDFYRQGVRYYGTTDCTDRAAAEAYEADLKAKVGRNEAVRRGAAHASRGQLVYFIAAGEGGPIKIGLAVDPAARIYSAQVFNHEKLILLATVTGGRSAEREYHRRFEAHRIHGEWFRRCPDILAEIARLEHSCRRAAA